MIETTMEFLKRLLVDLKRLLVVFLLVYLLSSLDGFFQLKENYAFLTAALSSTSIVLLVAAISHIIRRILFPNIDLKEFAREGIKNPLSASLVFLSVCIVLSAFIVANVMLLA